MNRDLYSPTDGNKGERTARVSNIKEKDLTLTLDISKSILGTFAVLVVVSFDKYGTHGINRFT